LIALEIAISHMSQMDPLTDLWEKEDSRRKIIANSLIASIFTIFCLVLGIFAFRRDRRDWFSLEAKAA
jgi:uncharacterized BrkB/YihY/UPF0761 family membrane protein